MFRVVGLQAKDVWMIGGEVELLRKPRTLRASATVAARVVLGCRLTIFPDDIPERHAAIRGWPLQKEAQLHLAQLIASESVLDLRPADSINWKKESAP